MTTAHLIQQAGLWPVLLGLILALAVVALRLAAFPLAALALGLDRLADAAAATLTTTIRSETHR